MMSMILGLCWVRVSSRGEIAIENGSSSSMQIGRMEVHTCSTIREQVESDENMECCGHKIYAIDEFTMGEKSYSIKGVQPPPGARSASPERKYQVSYRTLSLSALFPGEIVSR